jgi:hypothetical protein
MKNNKLDSKDILRIESNISDLDSQIVDIEKQIELLQKQKGELGSRLCQLSNISQQYPDIYSAVYHLRLGSDQQTRAAGLRYLLIQEELERKPLPCFALDYANYPDSNHRGLSVFMGTCLGLRVITADFTRPDTGQAIEYPTSIRMDCIGREYYLPPGHSSLRPKKAIEPSKQESSFTLLNTRHDYLAPREPKPNDLPDDGSYTLAYIGQNAEPLGEDLTRQALKNLEITTK